MADKEATVYVLDLGSSMGDCHNGRVESDLDWSMRYVWDKISTTVAASRKTWNVGVIGVRTDETNNLLKDEDGYDNISVLQELSPMSMENLRKLRRRIKANHSETGDTVSAVVLAIHMIRKFTKMLKYKRKIIVVTDGMAPIDDSDDFEEIASKINISGIELTILGVDFDDAEFGFKEEDKSSLKRKNERLFKHLADKCEGLFGTMAEAISELETPRLKPMRPYKTYDGPLTLGDPNEHQDAMSISVERYFKTHKAAIPQASRVVLKGDDEGSARKTEEGGDDMEVVESNVEFSAVKQARAYKVNDPDAPGGKRDVEYESLAKGYEYGRTAVPISESEYNITKLETTKSFSIVGFIHQEKYNPFLNMGEAGMTVAQKFNDAAALKLSSLIHSLHELDSYAIARIVTKDGKEPALILLAPHIENDFECLYDVQLPFAEDFRNYAFPPLDKIITVTGNTITKDHRNLPSEELSEAMDDYVDAMDISSWEKDDEGDHTMEYAAVEDVFTPSLHRINQVVRHRAIYPEQPIPPVPAILLKYANPPQDLAARVRSELEDLIDKADVKKVPPKAKGRKDRGDKPKPISGLDIDALLSQPGNKRTKIEPQNAIPQFKQMVDYAEDDSVFEDAAKQMGSIIRTLITNSFGDSGYDRAIENLGEFRKSMTDNEMSHLYNAFIRDLKKRLLSGELNGDRRELWWQIKGAKLGLIDNNPVTGVESSKVTPEEAAEFYKK